MSELESSKICKKCGFDHNDPKTEVGAVQVLACVLNHGKPRMKVFTRYGEVRPMTVIPIDKKKEKQPDV